MGELTGIKFIEIESRKTGTTTELIELSVYHETKMNKLIFWEKSDELNS